MEENKSKKQPKKDSMIDVAMAQMGEDATQYGEFIPSYFSWISLEEQKLVADKLEQATKEEKEEKKE